MLYETIRYENNDLYSDKEAFLRGNLFETLYKPYKNLTFFNIKPSNEKEELLLNLMTYSFVINDLNLYLDIHPNDDTMYHKFVKTVEEYDKYKELYIKRYGPLDVCDISSNSYSWVKDPWPWSKDRGIQYV